LSSTTSTSSIATSSVTIDGDDGSPSQLASTPGSSVATPECNVGTFEAALQPHGVRTLQDNYWYFPGTGERIEKTYEKYGDVRSDWLFTNDGYNQDGEVALLQVWGTRATELYSKLFEKTAGKDSGCLFTIRPLAKSDPTTDMVNLVLLNCEPNDYQNRRYKTILKLQTRKKSSGRKTVLTENSFPKPIAWQEDHLCYDDGTLIPTPSKWRTHTSVDESFNFDDLLKVDESPLKMQKLF
jgi:hypothetical protein